MYGSRLNLARAVWSDHSLDMNTASTRFFSLCGQDGWLQYRAAFYMSVIIYVDVQNIDGEFLYPMGKVSGIAIRSSPLPAKGKNNPSLGASPGRIAMR